MDKIQLKHSSYVRSIIVMCFLIFSSFTMIVSSQDAPELTGDLIVLAANQDDDFDIYLIDHDGNIVDQLTDNSASDLTPTWSPDGTQIAFTSNVDGDYDIYVLTLETGRSINLTNNSWDDIAPSWSPDGELIAFTSNRNANWDLYLMDSDGDNPVRLTRDAVFEGYSSWSPDGEHIAYVRDRDSNRDIYILNVDSGDIEALTARPTSADYSPAWSPDGDQIAFVSNRSGSPNIFVVDIACAGDSDECDQLATNLTSESSSRGNLDPAWSPDGEQILFASFGNDSIDIFVIDVDGSDLTQLTNTSFDFRFPAWAHLDPDARD